jgi:hypothetical protein
VCSHFGVDRDVRDTLGALSTEVGTPGAARKYSGPARAHTGEEEDWMRVCVCRLIRRVGEVAARGCATGLPVIAMADLPKI